MSDQKTEQKTDHEKWIREALEAGPTEGPFITFNDQVYRATDPDLTTPVASWNTSGFTMEGVSIDALYYAACNPAAIRALLADLDAVRGALEGCITAIERTDHYTEADRFAAAEKALAALQSQPAAAGVSDAELRAIDDAHDWQTTAGRMAAYRAILALRPQAVPMTDGERLVIAERYCTKNWTDNYLALIDAVIADVQAHHGITQRADGGEV